MGKCCYCGKPAGWFRSQHQLCFDTYLAEQQRIVALRQIGKQQISLRAHAALNGVESLTELPSIITRLKIDHELNDADVQTRLIGEWKRAVDAFLEDGLLVAEEERRLIEFVRGNGLQFDSLPDYDRVVKSAALTDLVNGRLPTRFSIPENLPINLLHGETIVWACANTAYLEDKTHRQFVGGSQGISIRIMSGVYYRIGAFKGSPIEHTERVHVDTGWFIVTDKHIYFAGPCKSQRIPYSKIVSIEPFNNGIGIHRDASSAKPQAFITGDGWFTYNLIANLARR